MMRIAKRKEEASVFCVPFAGWLKALCEWPSWKKAPRIIRAGWGGAEIAAACQGQELCALCPVGDWVLLCVKFCVGVATFVKYPQKLRCVLPWWAASAHIGFRR